MSVATRVIKNSSLLLFASIVNNLMAFVITLFTARYLGTYGFGLISSATSFVGIFGIFTDLGFSTYAVREVSRNKDLTGVYFGTVLFLRVIASIITVIVYCLFILYNNFALDATYVMLIFGVYMLFNSLVCCFYSLFQSNEKMEYQTIGNVIYSVLVLLFVLLMINQGGSVIMVAVSYSIAIFLALVFSIYITLKKYPKLYVCLKKPFLKEIIINGIPFGITGVFTSVYFWIAQIILTFLAGSIAVGLFSSSQKLLLVLASVHALFSNAIFPIMSELFISDKQKLKDLYHKVMKYLLIVSSAMVMGVFIYSKEIIYMVYGQEYVVGYHSLTILIWAGIFMFLSGFTTTLLSAINKQFSVTKNAMFGAIISVILNSILIYLFSYIGASISTVCTEFSMLVLMLYTLSKTEFKLNLRKSVKPIIQITIANVIMGIALYYLQLPFVYGLFVAIIAYSIALLITGSINGEDLDIVLGFFND